MNLLNIIVLALISSAVAKMKSQVAKPYSTLYTVTIQYGESKSHIELISENSTNLLKIKPQNREQKNIVLKQDKIIKLKDEFDKLYQFKSHQAEFCKRHYLIITKLKSGKKIYCLDSKTKESTYSKNIMSQLELYYKTQ